MCISEMMIFFEIKLESCGVGGGGGRIFVRIIFIRLKFFFFKKKIN